MKRVLATPAVAAALLLAAALLGGCNDSAPISKQSCKQLAKTLERIQSDLDPDNSAETLRKAEKDAEELNRRVAELGGCQDEPL